MAGIIFTIFITCFFTALTFIIYIFMFFIGLIDDENEKSGPILLLIAFILSIVIIITVIVLGSLWASYEINSLNNI